MAEALRAWIKRWVNLPLVIVTVVLGIYGAVIVTAVVQGYASAASMIKKEYLGLILGAILAIGVVAIDYRRFKTWWLGFLIMAGILLFLPKVPGLGVRGGLGGTLWVGIGHTALFQPSEPAKLLTILAVAAYVARFEGRIERVRDFLKAAGVAFIPFALLIIQGDLGTGLVTLAIMLGILLVGGANPRHLLIFIVTGIALIAGLLWVNTKWTYVVTPTDGSKPYVEHHLIKNYQLDRLTVFVNPSGDTGNAGYQLQQSKIAIGSGQFTGKGLSKGTQSTLNFLPTRHTDFIFAAMSEKVGFIGGMFLIALYLALLTISLSISSGAEDLFGTLIVVGIISMWLFQILENIGMNMGLMPITGIPLPFMSYGTSALITNMVCVGVLGSIWSHRPYLAATKGTIKRGISYKNY
ncbi:MAG: rod shape-determining protein RodA [Coriobacteriia bacterium]|nr:rod shape-determining protein RodA [Coriobacteriia bacterium]